MFTMVYHFLSNFLQIHFIVTNFNLDLIMRYSPLLVGIFYVLTAMVLTIIFKDKIVEGFNKFPNFAWSFVNVGQDLREIIKTKSTQMVRTFYVLIGLNVIVVFVNLPVCGNQSEIYIGETAYDHYFGVWGKFLHYIYFGTFPFLTSSVFDALGNCPWYIWNIKNRKTLLNFMTNCLKLMQISFAGMSLDYRLFLS
ncbi:hypothetical protein BDFB_012584, partial [Asbolus verrucosus]